ncbi:hypothetical protein BJ878DRAFT_482222 [Calycina marina]|uniref:Uncharacterized protein n=1 Tax=Calycina marina TaxID=1763456 RepID=A0A9P7YYU5_9HELO|nr:hypothetical protein BJ878DRAFT_482222 [Calycina marina]
MWKKLNSARGTHQPAIPEHPSPYDKVFDGSEDWEGRRAASRTVSQPVQRETVGPGGNEDREMPRLPFKSNPPPAIEISNAKYRLASSTYPNGPSYAKPSLNEDGGSFPRNSYAISRYQDDDVSPPSSPEFEADRNQQDIGNHEVSPIDSTPDMSGLALDSHRPNSRPGFDLKAPTSSIPVMRREKKRSQVKAKAQNLVARKQVGGGINGRTSKDPRWDPYSGEITTSDNGKPQSVKPGQFSSPQLRSTQKLPPSNKPSATVPVKAGPISSFRDRVGALEPEQPPAERPEWRGATGRMTIAPQVAAQPDLPPISIPRKSSKRVAPPVLASNPVSISPSHETAPTQESGSGLPTIKTVLNKEENSPRSFQTPTSSTPISDFPAPLQTPATKNSQMRGDSPQEVNNKTISRNVSTIERNFREAFGRLSSHNSDDEPHEQPSSKFSTTTTAASSVRPSTDTLNHPPLPELPAKPQPSPILNRKRPSVATSPAKATARKAVNTPSSTIFVNTSSSIATKRLSSTSSISKTLPQTPAEAQSLDLISSLQAQLDNLAHRRRQIEKSIRQMTELMPTDNLRGGDEVRRKRELEKAKIERLREEEADVRRCEHDIGLRLHRAYKRKDMDGEFELTGLWVRRVTG